MMFIDYGAADGCSRVICVKCGRCGRKFDNVGMLIDDDLEVEE